MSQPASSSPVSTTPDAAASTLHPDWMRRLLTAVVLSVVLGIVVQVLVMLAVMKWPKSLLAETAQKVTWSTVVCTALALGASLRRALPGVMGVLGLLSAPTAFFAAKAAQKSLAASAAAGPAVPSAVEIAAMKGVQYALFGVLIGYFASKRTWRAYVGVGALVGVSGAAYVLSRLVTGNDPAPPTPALVARGVNELVFPIGCALVLWIASALGRHARAQAAK